ncbi:MAG: NADH:ubiquinone reductase (Na(+)-transporting) subunit F [Kiritimatiellia bacterium]
MTGILATVLIVSAIAAGLALLLVIAERFIADYGPCKITINGRREITVQGGKPLLSALTEKKIFIPSACGGRGTCGACKLKVLEGGGLLLPTETPFISKDEIADNVRLSCQVKIRNDISIEIPEELFNIREFTARCAGIEDLTYDMKRFRFELQQPGEIDFVAGQYMQLLCPRYMGNNAEVYRAYSIASDPRDTGAVDLIIRRVPHGICTTWCFDILRQGDQVRMNGPYGDFRLSDTEAPMVFVAGGSGMAPFVSILHCMRNTGCRRKATYFFGASTTRDLCLSDQMQEFAEALPDFTFVPVVSRPEPDSDWQGETGLVTEAVQRHYDDLSGSEGYLCGGPGMIEAAANLFTSLGMPEDRIYYDKFA